ncbi:MAG: hypothetical protein APF84_09935 [Gracilibacter sp. BRH_c7a]|nr:MAG: hypothetical protein APF84_09935 [Gracilibacter sp. BRH_c7a]
MPKILIIEDSNLVRLKIKSVLENSGFKDIIETNSADLIVDKPYVYLQNVELIIMDISLPGISGIEAAYWLKTNINYSKIPVIFLSGTSDSITVKNALKAGGVDYIVKPFEEMDLIKRVSHIIGRPQNIPKDTSLTIDIDEAKKIISIEYSRSVRGKQPVSFIIMKVNNDIEESINKITKTLRQIDQIFILTRKKILLVLPLTDESGLKVVVDKIEKRLNIKGKDDILKKITYLGDENLSLEELINDMLN